MENTLVRNLFIAGAAALLFWPRKGSAGNGSGYTSGPSTLPTYPNPNVPLGHPSGNGWIPTTGTEGSNDESYHGLGGPRGVRNNNPGNIKFNTSNPWTGKIPQNQNTDAVVSDPNHPRYGQPTFEQFDSWKYGVRALIHLLKNSYIGAGENTIRKILAKYDPGHSQGYLDYLVLYTGANPDMVIHPQDEVFLKNLIQGIARFENDSKEPHWPEIITDYQYQVGRALV